MPTTEIGPPDSVDALLHSAAQLEAPELERFVERVLALRAERVAVALPADEAFLLKRINAGLPASVQRRYDELTAKRRAERLDPEERQELLALTDRVERADAERLRALAQLAQLRQVSVAALMAELHMRAPEYA